MTFATKHNGGRTQVNLNIGTTDRAHAVLNAIKLGTNLWQWRDNNNSPVTPDYLDDNGYLIQNAHSGVSNVFSVPTQAQRSGNYVIASDSGNGVLSLNTSPIQFVISAATRGAQTGFTLTPSTGNNTFNLKVGQPVVISGVGGTGWTGTGVNTTWPILAIDAAAKSVTIGFDSSGLGAPTLSGSSLASNTLTSLNGVLRCVVAGPSDGSVTFGIVSCVSSSDYLGMSGSENAIYYVHEDDEARLLSGETFGVKFKQRLLEANIGVLRMMPVQGNEANGSNQSTLTDWASRKPIGHVSYSQGQFRKAFYCTTTTNSGNAYSSTAPTGWLGTVGGVPTDKQRVHVVWNASASAAPCTLKITGGSGGDTGDINILNASATALGSGQYPVSGTFVSLSTLVYDATLNAWIKQGGGTSSGSAGINNGWPPEILLRLCGEVGAQPYWVYPHLALDPATDYVPALAQANKDFRDTYCPWLIPRYEGPNELWNNGGPFSGYGYANAKANAYGWGSTNYMDWYGKVLSTIGQAVAAVLGFGNLAKAVGPDQPGQYHILCGVQTGSGTSPNGAASSDARLTSAQYVAQAAAAQTLVWSGGTINFTKSAAKNWTSHVAIANYYAPAFYDGATPSAEETTLSAAYAGGAGDLTAPVTYADSHNVPYSSVTIVNGTPGKVNWPAHGLPANAPVRFQFQGAVGAGITTTPVYYVKTVVDVDNFTVSSSPGGSEIACSGSWGTVWCYNSHGPYTPCLLLTRYQIWKTWAKGHGINRMCGYEGGQSSDYTSGGASDLDKLKAAAKFVTSMPSDSLGVLGVRYKDHVAFAALSDVGFIAEYPSDYFFTGRLPSVYAWPILEDLYASPNPPLFEAARLFNNKLRRVNLSATT